MKNILQTIYVLLLIVEGIERWYQLVLMSKLDRRPQPYPLVC